MYNKTFLIGRLVKDPETRVTVSGITVSRFTIAVDKMRKKDKSAEEQTADFIRIVCWRRLAEICGQYLKKGKLVAIEGALQVDSYERDGQQRESTEIVADNVQMLDRGNDLAVQQPSEEEVPQFDK